jgi:hypothetical protein
MKGIVDEKKEKSLRNPKDNPCWTGYHPVGTKKKNGKTVPNCVPGKTDEAANPAQQAAIAIAMKKKKVVDEARKSAWEKMSAPFKGTSKDLDKSNARSQDALQGLKKSAKDYQNVVDKDKKPKNESYAMEDEQIDGMAQGEIREIIKNAIHIKNQLDRGVSLDGWMYSYITTTNDHLNSVAEQIGNPNIEEQGVRDTMGEGEVIKGPWSDRPKLRVVSNTPDINDIDQMARGFMKSKFMPPSLDSRTNREILNKVIIYIFETFPDAYKTMTDNQTYAIAKKVVDKVMQVSMKENSKELDEVSDTRTGTRKTGDLITGEHDSAYQRLKSMAPKLYDYIRNQAPVPVDPVMTLQFLQSMRGNQDAALARMKSELEKDTERMYGREYPVNEMPDTAGPVGTQPGGWRKMESSIMKGINGRK